MPRLTDEVRALVDALAQVPPRDHAPISPALTSHYQLRADKHCISSNFYALEYDKQGTSFRWSGPGRQIRFRLRLSPRSSWCARLRFTSSDHDRNFTETRLFVDRIPVSTTLGGEPGLWSLDSMPFEARARGCTQLIYLVAGMTVPSQSNPELNDHRRIGIAWHDLRVEPIF